MIVECPACHLRYDVTGRPPGTQGRCRCGKVFTLPSPSNQANSLGCPSCGARVAPTNHKCEYCATTLLVRACPRCFNRVFHGSKFCNACGAGVTTAAKADPDGNAEPLTCPRCERQTLVAVLVGGTLMDECSDCHGVWVDAEALERLVKEREQATFDAIDQRHAPGGPGGASPAVPADSKMYIKCPECAQVMNRINFGKCSGVIIDVCKGHGTWFDANELPKIIDFVMSGGLEKASQLQAERDKEREKKERQNRAAMAMTEGQYKAQHSMHRFSHRRSNGADVLAEIVGSFWNLFY